jgi:hypothetical protein
MNPYESFLESKRHLGEDSGFEATFLPDCLFDFQKALVQLAIKKGRFALFADCGLGKTIQELVWSQNVADHTSKPVLILTPLCVGPQFVTEGEKFGIECEQSRDGKFAGKIIVTNYEQLDKFNPSDFGGVCCDESGILKNFDGAIKSAVTEFMKKINYRLLGTATPAPNDYIELGTSSEALGNLGYIDMLQRFFKSTQNDSYAQGGYGTMGRMFFRRGKFGSKFRFKGHAERDFWRWVCSWSRAIRKPSDLGFSDEGFKLPKLIINEHIVGGVGALDGMLFALPAVTLSEQRREVRRSIRERCEMAAKLSLEHDISISFCNLNDEADLVEKLMPGSRQIYGNQSDEEKEEILQWFCHSKEKKRRLVSKGRIIGWGLNFQFCNHQTYFISHSLETFYQCVRRCWRFGQKKPVTIDLIGSEGERRVLSNLNRKTAAMDNMFASLVELMNNELLIEKAQSNHNEILKPKWL